MCYGFHYAEGGFSCAVNNDSKCAEIRGRYKVSVNELNIPATIGGYTVTSIGKCAFMSDYLLTSVTIPEGVTNIGERAFIYCISLKEVTIPNSVMSMGDDIFYNCHDQLFIRVTKGSYAEEKLKEDKWTKNRLVYID